MRKIFLVFLIFLNLSNSFAQRHPAKKLKKMKIYDNKILVYIPKEHREMTSEEYAKNFAGYRPPIAAFTSQDSYIHFTVNQALTHAPARTRQTFVGKDGKMYKKQAQWSEEDLRMMHSLYKSTIQTIHDKVTFLKDGVKEFNDRKFVYFEFLGTVKDEESLVSNKKEVKKQYSYILYTVEGSKILIFNFTCPASIKDKWRATTRTMMEKIKIGEIE